MVTVGLLVSTAEGPMFVSRLSTVGI